MNHSIHQRHHMEFLDPAGIDLIHQAVLEVLAKVGNKVMDPRARELLVEQGARVESNDIVFIPENAVEKAISTAPATFMVYDRQGLPFMELGSNIIYGCTPSTTLQYLDPSTGKTRPFSSKEAGLICRVADALPNLHTIVTKGNFTDPMPEQLKCRYSFLTALKNTSKPISATPDEDFASVVDIVELAQELAGGKKAFKKKPNMFLYTEPIPPLVHSPVSCQKVIYCAENGVPLVYMPYCSRGGTAPMSAGAALVQCFAEIYLGLILHQAACPGAPFMVGAMPSILDMRTSVASYGAPEFHMLVAASSQFTARKINVPFFGSGGCGDSKQLDHQAIIETTMSLLNSMVSGPHIVHDLGYMDHGVILSPQLLVLCNEIMDHFACYQRGVDLSDSEDWVQSIRESGPGGNYLQSPLTFENFRQIHYSDYFDRSMAGIPHSMDQKISERTLEIINNHIPIDLSSEQAEIIENGWIRWTKENKK
jgi:trimethylamine--corrinoid protein Co-methyltransferase